MASIFRRGGKRTGCWQIQWFDDTGKRRSKNSKTTDKSAAQRIANKLESDAALRRDGVIDAALDWIGKESQRTIDSHLADFEAKLRTGKRDAEHVRSTISYIRTIAKSAGFSSAADIQADGVNHFANDLGERRSSRTVEAYLIAFKAFTKWLTEHHKLPRDPLSSVKKPNPKTDRRRERRMLLPEEWRWLESVTNTAPPKYGMTGHERVLVYSTAIQSGLRSNELRSLMSSGLYLDSNPPYITCKGRSTKNKQDARQYVQSDLAAQLAAHIRTKAPKASVFGIASKDDATKMLREDLADARKEWLTDSKTPDERVRREQSDFLAEWNHDGKVFDFHALRHTTGAWLAMTGAHPKVVQQVLRHSSITLTMDTYGHLFPGQEADAVDRLRDFLGVPLADALRATGTDDQPQESPQSALHYAQQSERETVPEGAKQCANASGGPEDDTSSQVLRIPGFCERTPGFSAAEGTGLEPATRKRAPDFESGC